MFCQQKSAHLGNYFDHFTFQLNKKSLPIMIALSFNRLSPGILPNPRRKPIESLGLDNCSNFMSIKVLSARQGGREEVAVA